MPASFPRMYEQGNLVVKLSERRVVSQMNKACCQPESPCSAVRFSLSEVCHVCHRPLHLVNMTLRNLLLM